MNIKRLSNLLYSNFEEIQPQLLTEILELPEKINVYLQDQTRAAISRLLKIYPEIASTNSEFSTIGALLQACKAGKNDDKERLKAIFTEKLKAIDSILEVFMFRVTATNPKSAVDIECKRDNLKVLVTGLVSALDVLCANPKDASGQEYLAGMLKNWELDIADILALVSGEKTEFDTDDIIKGSGKFIFLLVMY